MSDLLPTDERAFQLAAELAEAVSKDEATEGCDLSAGLFGAHVSAWLRKVAAHG